jgi:hypothetical protein
MPEDTKKKDFAKDQGKMGPSESEGPGPGHGKNMDDLGKNAQTDQQAGQKIGHTPGGPASPKVPAKS